MKIGLMGGTFNPPHKAHIKMAEAAQKQYGLEKVLFMTGGNPPHKETETAASVRHHMVKLAIDGYEDFVVCDYEVKKEGYSYTADTLKYLKDINPADEFYFIIGGDSYDAIFTWYKPREILRECIILVCPRDGYPSQADVDIFNKRHHADTKLLNAEETDISSTKIRKMAEEGQDISKLLDSKVYDYIKRNKLYEKNDEPLEEHIKRMLKPERYAHSLGVASCSVALAELYGANSRKAYIAGFLHDCAKNLSPEEIKIKCEDLDPEIDDFELENPQLIHAKIGAELIKTEFGINDGEISEAIKWHTIGKPHMGILEKIVFVADMIEPFRSYPEVEELRKKAYEDIDEAVLSCVLATIEFNEERGRELHPNAYKIRGEMQK